MTNSPQTSRIARDERGQALTEFAFVLPILAVLLFGVIQFGILYNHYVTVTDAVRAGARKGAVSRYMGVGAATQACSDAVKSSAPGLKQPDLQISCNSTWQPGTDLTVTASYPYKIDLLGIPFKSGRLSSTTTERVE
jgi:Flp pilus assembly protein TadG